MKFPFYNAVAFAPDGLESALYADDDFDAVSAFEAHLKGEDPEEPKKKPEEGVEGDGEIPEPDDKEGGEGEVGEEGEGEGTSAADDEDDAEIELKIGEETRRVKVGDVKRLLQSEPELTARSARLTEAEQVANTKFQHADIAIKTMLQRAQEALKPYQELNFLTLSKQLDVATLEQVQKDAQAAYNQVQFFQTELNQLHQAEQQRAHGAYVEAARAAITAVQDEKSPAHIPNFGREVFGEMVNFATQVGIPRQAVETLTDPGALKLLHMAMLYTKGQVAAEKKVVKVGTKPTKVLKPAAATSASSRATRKTSEALNRLKKSGSVEDAADAFLAGFKSGSDD